MTVLSRLYGGVQHYGSLLHAVRSRGLTLNNIWHTSARGFKRSKTKTENKVALIPEAEFQTPNHDRMKSNLMKCALFTAVFCSGTYAGVTIVQYERVRYRSKQPMTEWITSRWNVMEGWKNKQGEYRQNLNRWWNDLSSGQRVFWPICFLNTLVFLCWRHPAWKYTMMKYFAFSPAGSAVCWPMLLSTFSHHNLFHLFANMYVMHSFSTGICDKLGQEQFMGMYLCCGVLSSLAGGAFKVLIRSPIPSLGASGALMGMLGYFCSTSPDSRLGIIFIPNFNFSAEQGLWALLLFDTLGLIFRFGIFDHAAHLSGALSGLAYAKWGDGLWAKRQTIMQQWHNMRQQLDQATKDR